MVVQHTAKKKYRTPGEHRTAVLVLGRVPEGTGFELRPEDGEDLAPRSEDTWGRVWLGTPDISCSRMPWTR